MHPSQPDPSENCACFPLRNEVRASDKNILREIAPGLRSGSRELDLGKLLRLVESDPVGSIQNWAKTLNISESRLQLIFKLATGIRLSQALTERRLQRAAQLLANTNMSIKEIAGMAGYQHTSSFARAFEKRFEQTPRHYRLGNAA